MSYRTLALSLIFAAMACDAPVIPTPTLPLEPLRIESVSPASWMPGTELQLEGAGFVSAAQGTLVAEFSGTIGGVSHIRVAPVRVAADAVPGVPITRAAIRLDPNWTEFWASDATFIGRITLRRVAFDRLGAPGQPAEAYWDGQWGVSPLIAPAIVALGPTLVYPGAEISVYGGGFLMASEGLSVLYLDGDFTTAAPPTKATLSSLPVPLSPVAFGDRTRTRWRLSPDILGIRPGQFEGVVTVVNVAVDGQVSMETPPLAVTFEFARPFISNIGPRPLRRGQWMEIEGGGFLPADGLLQSGMVFLFDGLFVPDRGTPWVVNADQFGAWVPESRDPTDDTHAQIVLEPTVSPDGQLVGLGAEAGDFTGQVTPVALFGADSVAGAPVALELRFGTPLQAVVLRRLPQADAAIATFGLDARASAVWDQVLANLRRDYSDVNIAFTYTAPSAFARYSIVEIGSIDPNGAGLFGLDNTAGKDTGNLRFDDIIGGFNADTRAQGFAAYGGIFIEELFAFSERIGDSPLKSPRFDAIFAPFAPRLGGTPMDATASDSAQTHEAVRALAALISATIGHEVGHSLGLTAIDGLFHNEGDGPGWIMDAGIFRPFEERAELDGLGPATFSPNNRDYLQRILPVDP